MVGSKSHYYAVLSKKDVSIDTPLSATLTSTSHNSRLETPDHILTSPNTSDNSSDLLGIVRVWPSVSEGELWDVKERVTENILNLDTSFLLNTSDILWKLKGQHFKPCKNEYIQTYLRLCNPDFNISYLPIKETWLNSDWTQRIWRVVRIVGSSQNGAKCLWRGVMRC